MAEQTSNNVNRWPDSVDYVEPNDVNMISVNGSDGVTQKIEVAPKLENFCIALGLEVELNNRNMKIQVEKGDKTITMLYTEESGFRHVNFFKGSLISDSTNEKYFTTYYADMTSSDVTKKGSSELLGIKSVNVEYDNYCVPQITVVFTDVRGMSLFQPSDMDMELKSKGYAGIDTSNISEAFFRSFFLIPPAKFTMYLKGFYGEPVAYQVTVADFRASFDSENGDFDITVKFIGYTFSFLTEVSLNALIAAPFSDYIGKEYWDEQVKNNRFVIPISDTNTSTVRMPTLAEVINNYKDVVAKTEYDLYNTSAAAPFKDNTVEINTLTSIIAYYRAWYANLILAVNSKYGEKPPRAVPKKYGNDEYEYVIIHCMHNQIEGASNLSSINNVLFNHEGFKAAHENLCTAISQYNNTNGSSSLQELSDDLSEFPRMAFITEAKINLFSNLEEKFTLDEDTLNSLSLSQDEVISASLVTKEHLNKIIENAKNDKENTTPNSDIFFVKVDYKSLVEKVNSLSQPVSESQAADASAAIEKTMKERVSENLAWYPSVENFTKIVMAHMETLMKMIFSTVDYINTEHNGSCREPNDLGVTVGSDGNCPDVPLGSVSLPPFPRVTEKTTVNGPGGDTIQVMEDKWIGDFNSGKGFKETDLVNGLLNGVNEISKENTSRDVARNNWSVTDNTPSDGTVSKIPYPITPFDFYIRFNPYGDNKISSFAEFAAKVAYRAYIVTCLSRYSIDFKSEWKNQLSNLGSMEADNFNQLVKFTNGNIISAIKSQSFTATDIISIIKGDESAAKYKENGGFPWGNEPVAPKDKFVVKMQGEPIFPLQNINWDRFNDYVAKYNSKLYDFSDECNNNVYPILPLEIDKKETFIRGAASTVSFFNYDLVIDDDIRRVYSFLAKAKDDSNNANNNIIVNIWNKINANKQDFANAFECNGKISSFYGVNSQVENKESITVDYNDFSKNNPDGFVFSNDTTHSTFQIYLDQCLINGNGNINSVFIAQAFGIEYDNNKGYVQNKNNSLFSSPDYYKLKPIDGSVLERTKFAFFLNSLCGISFNSLVNYIGQRTHFYLPRVVVLQIGSVLYGMYYACGKSLDAEKMRNCQNKLSKLMILPECLGETGIEYLVKLPYFAKISLINYFIHWSDKLKEELSKFEMKFKFTDLITNTTSLNDEYNNDIAFYYCPNNKNETNHFTPRKGIYLQIYFNPPPNLYTANAIANNNAINKVGCQIRAIFNQYSPDVQMMTSSLLSFVSLTRCHEWGENAGGTNVVFYSDKQPPSDAFYNLEYENLEVYLKSFLDRLKTNLDNESGNTEHADTMIRQALSSTQATKDMKISLYLYLKQLYDKWIPGTSMEEWKFENFFKDTTTSDGVGIGNQFHFIDSFYNKIGDRLLLNPQIIVDILEKSMYSNDWNGMLLQFISDIYAKHGCMFKCIQNFNDLTKKGSMENMFKPVSYYSMKAPKRNPDFIVLYVYKPSEHLDLNDGQYENDSFMLNDESKCPLAITSRRVTQENNEKMWYHLPAFGVCYGGQYQSYFKKIDINMDNPIATEQSIGAKLRIGNMYRSTNDKGVMTTAQDIYNVFSNMAYQCKIEMLGCAWIQPMMYFVLLNVPLFKGSYMVMKVTHKMTPGNMLTEFVGQRMSNVANKIVSELVYGGSSGGNGGGSNDYQDYIHRMADASNNCEYKKYPLYETTVGTLEMTEEQLNTAVSMVEYLLSLNTKGQLTAIAAAGIVGFSFAESSFNPQALYLNDKGQPSGGILQWRGENLQALMDKDPDKYGKTQTPNWMLSSNKDVKRKYILEKIGNDTIFDQLNFFYETITSTSNFRFKGASIQGYNSCLNPEAVIDWHWENYGRGDEESKVKTCSERKGYANTIYKEYMKRKGTPQEAKSEESKNKIYELFFKAVEKTFKFCTSNGSIKYNVNENFSYNGKKYTAIEITETSEKRLYKVFDIILSTYYENLLYMSWNYAEGNVGGVPKSLTVIPLETVNERRTICVKTNGQETNVPQDFSKQFLMSIRKKYGGGDSPNPSDALKNMLDGTKYKADFKKELDKVAINECNTLVSSASNSKFLTAEQIKKIAWLFDGKPISLSYPNGTSKEFLDSYMTEVKVSVRTENGKTEEITLICHKKLARKVESIFDELLMFTNMYILNDEYGCYTYRCAKNTGGGCKSSLSNHALGCAIDLNWSVNGYYSGANKQVHPNGTVDIPINKNQGGEKTQWRNLDHLVVKIFKKYGFDWGGAWNTVTDYMHFSWLNG